MTYKTLYVKDAYINTTIYDDSAVTVSDAVLPKKLTVLQPIFAPKGKANVIMDFSSASLVTSTYGSDMENLEKYGQGGMNLIHAMKGGASAQVCRLLPDNATVASLLVKLQLQKVDAVEEVKDPNSGEVTTPGAPAHVLSKLIFDNKCDADATSGSGIELKDAGGEKVTSVAACKTAIIPLFKLVYNGAGKCGNDMGITIENDYERDGDVEDGRRYILRVYEKDARGNNTKYGKEFYFSLNPDALLTAGTQVYENLQYVFTDKDTSGNERAVICKPYIMSNFEVLNEFIKGYCDETIDPLSIDILNCTDKDGIPYCSKDETGKAVWNKWTDGTNTVHYTANFKKDESSNPIGSDAIYYLDGGSDGSLQLGYKYTKTVNGAPSQVVVTEEEIENTKNSLLCAFFKGQIDPAVFDERMVVSDIVFDANYSMKDVKPVMLGKFRDIRPDIMVIADIGLNAKNCTSAMSLVKGVKAFIDDSAGYTAAIIAHAGYTTDRALNKHVTGTYDYAYGLAHCYGLYGTFSVFAGYQQAKVTTMEFDWLPYKDEHDTMVGPLRKLGCIFAFKIDRKGTVAYMSEENCYSQSTSKLKSIRNGMVIGDAVRLGKSVLIKYVYDNDGAAGAIRKASSDLAENLSGRYPSNITVSSSLYQSERDKLLETTSCDLTYYFPGMSKGWTLNIYAKRGE